MGRQATVSETTHTVTTKLRRDHPDVIAALAMGLVTMRADEFNERIKCFIGDRDVTKIVGKLFKYNVVQPFDPPDIVSAIIHET